MAAVLTLPISCITQGSELPTGAVSQVNDHSPRTPGGNSIGNRTPTANSSGSRTPNSRRSRRANKLKTWAPDTSIPSRGSKNHFQEKCRPCFAFNTPEGCDAGHMCNFCHYPHDEDNFDTAVHFSQEKNARRLSFQADVITIDYDSEQPIQPAPQGTLVSPGKLDWQSQCAICMPVQKGHDPAAKLLAAKIPDASMRRRRNTAPAIFSYNPILPFCAFPEADKMEATPNFCKQVLAVVDSEFVADVLRKNMPETYED